LPLAYALSPVTARVFIPCRNPGVEHPPCARESCVILWVSCVAPRFPLSLASRGLQFTSRLTVQESASDGGQFSVLVRCPFWATTGSNVVTLNGQPVPGATPGSYLNVTRVWTAGDVLQVYWPAAVRFEQLTDDRPQWQGVGALLYVWALTLVWFASRTTRSHQFDPLSPRTRVLLHTHPTPPPPGTPHLLGVWSGTATCC
jgi:hypothetical protein